MPDLNEKLEALEKFYGGAGLAAKALGVTATSWSRWKRKDEKTRVEPSGPRLILINLLYEQATTPKKVSNA